MLLETPSWHRRFQAYGLSSRTDQSPSEFRQIRPAGPHLSHHQPRPLHGGLVPTSNGHGLGKISHSVTFQSPSASAASRRHNLQQRPRAGGTRLTHLRVTTSPCRFTEVLNLPATATGGAVLSRLRLGGRRAAGPAVTNARHWCSPPTDRSPTQQVIQRG